MTLECIYGYGIVDKNKCDCVVESGIVERKMLGNTDVIIYI
jgi:hypothetical protein